MNHETKEILSAVLNKLESMDVKIDGLANETTEIRKDLNEFKNEMNEFRDEMNDFKKEAYWRFDNVNRQLRLFNADMDHMNHEIAENKREIKSLKTT